MQRAVTGLLALLATFNVLPAEAQAQRGSGYAVCLRVYGPVSYNECNFTSMAQCKASASGRPADCYPNSFAAEPAMPTRRTFRRTRTQ